MDNLSGAVRQTDELLPCHCERSEAISTRKIAPDCFVVPPRNDYLRKLGVEKLDSSVRIPFPQRV